MSKLVGMISYMRIGKSEKEYLGYIGENVINWLRIEMKFSDQAGSCKKLEMEVGAPEKLMEIWVKYKRVIWHSGVGTRKVEKYQISGRACVFYEITVKDQ